MTRKIQSGIAKIRCNFCGKIYDVPAGHITTLTQGDIRIQCAEIDYEHNL